MNLVGILDKLTDLLTSEQTMSVAAHLPEEKFY